MKKPDPHKLCSVEAEISNLAMMNAETSPFAGLGYKADAWKAYVEFDICHSLPDLLGPVESGNYVGYFPDTLAASHESLRHQQFNLRHMLAAYNPAKPAAGKPVMRDRIIGCVVATHFPKPTGMKGWLSPGNPDGATACIRACAVVFKLAEGVPKMLGEHLTSRKRQSVSIECTTSLDNIGIWVPSTRQLMPILDPTDEVVAACTPNDEGLPTVGKLNGEQLVVVYGLSGRPVAFRGVGMTPNPAERTAKIVSVTAEDSELYAIAAESINAQLVDQEVHFRSGRIGTIRKVTTQGEVRIGGLRMTGTDEDPVLTISIPEARRDVLHRLSAVQHLC